MSEDQPYFATLDHDRYRRTVIRTITAHTNAETGAHIPENVMFVGEDWVYLAKVRYVKGTDCFTITPVDLLGLQKPVNVSQMVKHIYPRTERIALIPEGEQRMQEARELGDVVDEQEFSFRVRTGEHNISVYRMRDARHVISDNDKLSDGALIGLTDLKQ